MSEAGSTLTINECIGKTFNFSTYSKNIVFKITGYTINRKNIYIEINGDIVRRKIYDNDDNGAICIKEQNEWCYLRSGRIVMPINNSQLDAEYIE